ncbi:MAG: RnfABCDGE type electron transport complex subunit B [Oscillospiraceae bacterium]|nr:RnfABCDGE type electron transport complex subunit B [Oscillospiraceae bacterium]
MSGTVLGTIIIVVIGIICGVILTVASKVMAVKTDERIPKVRACLPGANCGACGFAGCDGYAKALVEDGVPANLCVPGGANVASQVSEILGVECGETVVSAAVLHCRGDIQATKAKMDYRGIESCKAAKLLFGGTGLCTFGCLGYGDCEKACSFGGVKVVDGLARIDMSLCTGCGSCAAACPNKLITVTPENVKVAVLCSNTEKGADTRKKCTNGCIGCKKCERECPAEAITVENNLAKIDYSKCTGCGHCAEVCVVKCIKPLDISAKKC